ncbi:IBR domain-containing protein [Macrophomina phaseolina]|uniref:RBR-type E3 ubiquitin transferase n=1 Tax=Macrophomina phaseolina TaxID=35725 RepID=A0ABQ8G5F0_9PEZI|nr:IBR domain-containing protein [Macrophomina phaseolina]
MAHQRRFSHLLDGVGAIFAPKPRAKDPDRHRRRDDHPHHDYDYDYDHPRSSRRPRRNAYDVPDRYPRPEPSPVDAPDVDHLRQARADYYARRRPSAPAATAEMDPRLTRAASARKSSKSKRHDRPSRKEREDRDSGVFVYSTPRSGGSRSRPVDSREEDLGDSRSRSGAHRRTVSSPAAHVIDVEVEREPEPSVRRADGVRLSRTMSARDQNRPAVTRPSLRRTGTIKSPPADAPPATPASHHSRRNSGLFGLFRPVPAPHHTPEKKYDCMICLDEVRASRCPRLPCGHRMCHTCLKRQFELSVRDPQHMPPRCCTNDHIPLKFVDRIFDTKFKVLWNKKYQEYTAKNRTYCPTRGCGEWIKPSHVRVDPAVGRKYGKCPRCRGKVCMKCGGRWHLRKECPKDEDAQQFAEMAKESGWQRCYNCKAMVELKEGCNHMTCRCTAQFCMLCGAKWKTCECPWFNYAHLDEEDRLQNMRVPEPYIVIEHDAHGGAPPPRPPPNARPDQYAVPAPRQAHPVYAPQGGRAYAGGHDPDLEREDEMLARRLQSQYLAEGAGVRRSGSYAGGSRAGDSRRHHHHRHRTAPSRYESPEIEVEVLGVGNAAGHHMNDFGAPAAAAAAAAAAPRAPRSTIIRRTRTTNRRATEADRETARNMGYGAYSGQAQPQAARPVEASVMAGLGDPARSGMGRVGMWLNYVENDPAEVEGRAQRAQGVMAY